MSKSDMAPMLKTNYQVFISRIPGTTAWNNLYVLKDGQKTDVTNNGDKSCAYMVSGVLVMFGLSTLTHATIRSTLEDMKQSGWYVTDKPQEGSVIEWDGHIGFFAGNNQAISTSSLTKTVTRHPLTMNDGRKPLQYWSHLAIESDEYTKPELDRDPILPTLEKGTYRHNKSGHLYEVIGITFNVETNEPLVLYRPLYETGYEVFARPYDMFVKQVELNSITIPRFEKIDD